MSNATDILLVDGDSVGVVLCAPRPVQAIQYHGDRMYVAQPYERSDGRKYWIASQEEPESAFVDVLIDNKNFQPAWDLR